MMLFRCTRRSGFTLIELMVVIAIISILASFSVPSFERHIAKANLVDIQLYSNTLTNAIDEYILTHSEFPDSTTFASFKPDHSEIDMIKLVSLTKVDELQGTISISFNSDIGVSEDQYIRFARANTGQWSCYSSLDSHLLPEHCSAASQQP
ncbi:Fimbrial protein precursor [Marinomonas aquimarina]|uniref:Fimbrial protein n=1 Tax=Marinomonas aquimarina TaxID=295068 RepID=A0A1A8TE91_9GAMM|nr:prepilin-type N-terminal cleavage/methylation domain-containing protein [Marinomonas aquimarina]SBS31247.1 Fimbrial protein precursor [Marinomonas aquimarina]